MEHIDRLMKAHFADILHVVEMISARLCQLESRTRNLENSIDDLKDSVEFYHGATDGKLKQIENILTEVNDDVQVLRDKQEISEAKLQLAMLQLSKSNLQSPNKHENTQSVSVQQLSSSAPQQSHQAPTTPPIALPQPQPTTPSMPHHHHPPPPPSPPHNQTPCIPQHETYYIPRGQTQDMIHQYYSMPSLPQPQPQPQPTTPPPPPHHHPPPQPPNQIPYYIPCGQTQDMPHQHYPTPPMPAQHYPPSYSSQQAFVGPSSQPFYQKEPSIKPSSEFSRLQASQKLPHALPIASSVDSSSGSSETGNHVTADDVIDKVTAMGFPRDQVRITVRKLTEAGKTVNLNALLDKLMSNE